MGDKVRYQREFLQTKRRSDADIAACLADFYKYVDKMFFHANFLVPSFFDEDIQSIATRINHDILG